MDHMIKEKFIVTDGEKVTDEIYRVTGLDIEIDQIIENISSEESNIYFFDKDLSEKPENEKDVILAWIDTGIKVNGWFKLNCYTSLVCKLIVSHD